MKLEHNEDYFSNRTILVEPFALGELNELMKIRKTRELIESKQRIKFIEEFHRKRIRRY